MHTVITVEPPSEIDRIREELGPYRGYQAFHDELRSIHEEAATLLGNAKSRRFGKLKREEAASLRRRLVAVERRLKDFYFGTMVQFLRDGFRSGVGERLEASVEMERTGATLEVQDLEAEVERRASKRLQVALGLFAVGLVVVSFVCGWLAQSVR
jgi:hypothetical protein